MARVRVFIAWRTQLGSEARGAEDTLQGKRAESASHDLYISLRWTPYPVIVTIRDKKDCIRVLLYSYYVTLTG